MPTRSPSVGIPSKAIGLPGLMVREDKDKDFNPLGCHRDLIQHFLDAIVQTTVNPCQNISSRLYLYIHKLIL